MKPELLPQNSKLNHLIEPSFQSVNRIFVLAFENDSQGTSNKRNYLPGVEIKDWCYDWWKKLFWSTGKKW